MAKHACMEAGKYRSNQLCNCINALQRFLLSNFPLGAFHAPLRLTEKIAQRMKAFTEQ